MSSKSTVPETERVSLERASVSSRDRLERRLGTCGRQEIRHLPCDGTRPLDGSSAETEIE